MGPRTCVRISTSLFVFATSSTRGRCDELFHKAEEAAENETIKERIRGEHLSIQYLMAVRMADAEARSRATDDFAKEVRARRLTEIMERMPLEDSFEYMKRAQYAKDRTGRYRLYYIVR